MRKFGGIIMTSVPGKFGPFIALLAALASCDAAPAPVAKSMSGSNENGQKTDSISADDLQSCVSDMRSRKIPEIVKSDISKGERRFYWTFASEGDLLHPPGVATCQPRHIQRLRSDKVHRFDDGKDRGDSGFKCMMAIHDYKVRYNWEMATVEKSSISENCSGENGKLDRYYTTTNAKRYGDFYGY